MKKVISSHSEVAHVWASRTQDEGKANRMFFRGDTIYSYGTHFPIAKFHTTPDGKTVVLFTYDKYSISTSKHISHVHQAINHLERVYCYTPDASATRNLDEEKLAIEILLESISKTNHKKRIGNLSSEIICIIERAKKYADAMGEPHADWMQIPDDMRATAEQRRIERAAEEEARALAREAENKRRLAEAAERLEKWVVDNEIYASGFYSLPVKLRVKDDEIQTSHGANIPVDHAVRIWPLLRKAHMSGNPVIADESRTLHLGHYRFNSFKEDILTVGCHQIPYGEIVRMAEQLGLLETT
jgi:hypothetical protein